MTNAEFQKIIKYRERPGLDYGIVTFSASINLLAEVQVDQGELHRYGSHVKAMAKEMLRRRLWSILYEDRHNKFCELASRLALLDPLCSFKERCELEKELHELAIGLGPKKIL